MVPWELPSPSHHIGDPALSQLNKRNPALTQRVDHGLPGLVIQSVYFENQAPFSKVGVTLQQSSSGIDIRQHKIFSVH